MKPDRIGLQLLERCAFQVLESTRSRLSHRDKRNGSSEDRSSYRPLARSCLSCHWPAAPELARGDGEAVHPSQSQSFFLRPHPTPTPPRCRMYALLPRRILSPDLKPLGRVPLVTSAALSAASLRPAVQTRSFRPSTPARVRVANFSTTFFTSPTPPLPRPPGSPTMAPKDKVPKFELKTPKGTKDCESRMLPSLPIVSDRLCVFVHMLCD